VHRREWGVVRGMSDVSGRVQMEWPVRDSDRKVVWDQGTRTFFLIDPVRGSVAQTKDARRADRWVDNEH
jgi:hypothetical protein